MGLYCSAADVARKLDIPKLTTLADDASLGSTTLRLKDEVDIAPGDLLAIGYRGLTVETGQILSMQSATELTLTSGLAAAHFIGERIIDVTAFGQHVGAASRAIDRFTKGRNDWLLFEEDVNETLFAKNDRDGNLLLALRKRPVKEVSALTYALTPNAPTWTEAVDQIWWGDDDYIVKAFLGSAVPIVPGGQDVYVKITYTGGYEIGEDMPEDIAHSAAVLAARFWKEKDSGYSDTIGSPETGEMTYKLAIPKDIKMMLEPYIRVGVGM